MIRPTQVIYGFELVVIQAGSEFDSCLSYKLWCTLARNGRKQIFCASGLSAYAIPSSLLKLDSTISSVRLPCIYDFF